MTNTLDQVIKDINAETENRFRLELRRKKLENKAARKLAKVQSQYGDLLAAVHLKIDESDEKIRNLIDTNREELIAPGKKSFITHVAKFQLRDQPSRTQIVDADAIMQVARALGVIRKIATPPKPRWKFNQKKFFAWLPAHGDLRAVFEEYLMVTPAHESLTITPNTSYFIIHGKQRISPPSITTKSPPREE